MSENVNIESLQKQFAAMGADLRVKIAEPPDIIETLDKNGRVIGRYNRSAMAAPFSANILGTGKREYYNLTLDPERLKSLQVVDLDRDGKHLLLHIQTKRDENAKQDPAPQKFLMGHDEYHWFMAPVPTTAINVAAAKQALKPTPVQQAQSKAKIRTKNLHKRHQEAFVRQGEWFFVPEPDLVVNPRLILKKEPIRRGRGKPHVCEELYRVGGAAVMVSSTEPNGISMEQYNTMSVKERRDQGPIWRQMMSNPRAYARGRVTHPDHSTIRLSGWHRIRVNNEAEALRGTGVVMNWLD